MLAYAGINPNDVKWLSRPGGSAMNAFIDRQADAFLAFPPEPQELRARKIGHVLLEHRHRPALVAVLLLHGRREPRLRAALSRRYQACAACDPEGDRPLHVGAAAGGRLHARSRLRTAL